MYTVCSDFRAGGATQASQASQTSQAMAWAIFGLQGSTCLSGYRQITNYTVLYCVPLMPMASPSFLCFPQPCAVV